VLQKKTFATMIAALLLATGCGGGSSAPATGSPAPGGTGSTPQSAAVAGPLDTVQSAVTANVFVPLVTATEGTPLQSVLLCANGIATRNVLDVADAFANGLANPATLIVTTPAQAQAAVTALVGNLSGLLTSFDGTRTCFGGSTAPTTGVPATNPLAGTPLAPLGDALLPVLLSASQQLAPLAGGGVPSLSAVQLSGLIAQLSNAFSDGIAALPPEALTAPLVGGSLVTVDDALARLAALANLASTGGSPEALATSLQSLAQSVLGNLLTQVLPVGNLQDLAGGGASTDLVATLQAAVAALTASLGTDPTTALPANPLSGVGFASLTTLLDTLTAQLPGALTGSAGLTALEAALGQLQTLLNGLLGLGGGGGSTCQLDLLGLCLLP